VSEQELFVVCKNCSAEVSMYVTECPYCGQRVRKRAPKLDKEARRQRRARRAEKPRLGRLRRGEMPGIAADVRPYATGTLILLSLVAIVLFATGQVTPDDLGAIFGPIGNQWWRFFTAPFIFPNAAPRLGYEAGYAFISLTAAGVFGTLIERRFGPAGAAVTFVLCGAVGAAVSTAAGVFPVIGANGIALGLLTAWVVDDRLAARRGDDRQNDLLGVGIAAALLLLLPFANTDASWAAGLGGAAMGAIVGAVLSPLRP
jgi:membrane associated rhomboid family serine protease/DNA-directed RNA polymerase subunit RPC12/RpoP